MCGEGYRHTYRCGAPSRDVAARRSYCMGRSSSFRWSAACRVDERSLTGPRARLQLYRKSLLEKVEMTQPKACAAVSTAGQQVVEGEASVRPETIGTPAAGAAV